MIRSVLPVLFAATMVVLTGKQAIGAEPLPDLQAVRDHADAGMALVGKGRAAEGIRRMADAWPIPAAEIQQLIEQTDSNMQIMARRFGNNLGHELIAEHLVGASYLRRAYLQRFVRHAVTWRFVYYRSEDGWYVNNISFTDELDGLFESYGVSADAAAP